MASPSSYHSSAEKDIVRREFDLPLIESVHQRAGRLLRYFGLPGEEALDLKAWGHRLSYVAAVDFDEGRLTNLERRLDTSYPELRYRTHHGDADRIILTNGSTRVESDGNRSWRYVSTTHRRELPGYIWDFDVVYLDYFGKFLPYDRGSPMVQKRAQALRHLFSVDRQDAWQPWLLMVTVESRLFGPEDRQRMRDYLEGAKVGVSNDIEAAVEHLLETGLSRSDECGRLVHGTMSYIVSIAASNADVTVRPRGTIHYNGANGLPMLHLAFEIVPAGMLAVNQDPLPLLRAPIVRVRNDASHPWFELAGDQVPGQTQADLNSALDFLPATQLNAIYS